MTSPFVQPSHDPQSPRLTESSDPEHSARALSSAGFVSPSCRQVTQVWRARDPDDVFEVITRGTVRAAAVLRAQSPSARQAIKAAMRDIIASYSVGDFFDVPAPAVLAAAIKP